MKEVRIPDIRNPVLLDVQREAMERAERTPLDMSVGAVLAEASKRTGLSDFGPEDFKERLALILRTLDEDQNHTALAKVTLFHRTVRLAANRLLAFDLLRRHPEIHDIEIRRPIIIVGLPRSGTTHLLNLLAADQRLESLKYWISLEPIANPKEPMGPDGVDPRYKRAADAWEQTQKSNPYTIMHHSFEPEHIHEDLELQMPDFASYVWEFAYRNTPWRDYHLSHDQTPHYAFGKTMLKILDWQSGNRRRWVLKCPQHIDQLRPIMNVYPDAQIVFTHRDPVASVQSIATMMAYRTRMWDKQPMQSWYLDYWAERMEGMLRAYLRDLDLVPEAQRFDVPFAEFMKDDVEMAQRVLEHAGLPRTAESHTQLVDYMKGHQRGAHGLLKFDLLADFGVDPAALRKRFAFYLDTMPVAIEARAG